MKLTPTTASYVFMGGCSDVQPYKRRREVYENVHPKDVKAAADKLGLVHRSRNTGDRELYTVRGLDTSVRGYQMPPFIAYAGNKATDSGVSIMEIWYEAEPCSKEEADQYFNSRTCAEAKNDEKVY